MGLITELIADLIARIRAGRRGGGGGGGGGGYRGGGGRSGGRSGSGRTGRPPKSPEQAAAEAAYKTEMGGLYDNKSTLIPELRDALGEVNDWNPLQHRGLSGKLFPGQE